MNKKLFLLLTIPTSFFFVHPAISMMEEKELEEYKIPNKILLNNVKWEDAVYEQLGPTCASHAVSDCLRYVHGLKYLHASEDIMPYYLHKHTHYHYNNIGEDNKPAYLNYETGHSVKELMTFVRDYGVPETPENKSFKKDSGLSFPSGTRKYAFNSIYSVYDNEEGKSKVEQLKNALVKYKHPIAVSITSRLGEKKLFIDNTIELPSRLIDVPEETFISPPPTETKIGHAVTVYGYSNIEEGFLIKNSWGEDWRTKGKAILKYDYLIQHGRDGAYIGFGEKHIEKDYGQQRESEDSGCIIF